MSRYRLVTAGVPYVIPDSTVEAPANPANDLAVALLHQELAQKVGRKTTDTRIQHRDFRSGSWITHEGTGTS